MTILYGVYAALLLVGGLIGFFRARSTISLAASALSAIVIAVAGIELHHHPRLCSAIGLVIALTLGAFFFGRYQVTKKAMPSLLMTVSSAIVLIASALRLLNLAM